MIGWCRLRRRAKPAVWQKRSPEELRNLTALAQAAVGFDSDRGDLLTVEDLAFDENRAVPPAAPLSRALSATAENSPLLLKYAALLLGILVVMAFGVRPALRRMDAATKKAAGAVRELGAGQKRRSVLRGPYRLMRNAPGHSRSWRRCQDT